MDIASGCDRFAAERRLSVGYQKNFSRQDSSFRRCRFFISLLFNDAFRTAAASQEQMTEAVSTFLKRTTPALERMTVRKTTKKSTTISDLHFNEAATCKQGGGEA
jgi:hypothetical protein